MSLRIESEDQKLLWATPLLVRRMAGGEELNAELEALILGLSATDPGRRRSAYGGWQSTGDLFEIDAPPLRELHAACAQAVADLVVGVGDAPGDEVSLRLSGWANVLEPGGYHTFHSHVGCHLSGVYYVRVGEPDPGNEKSGTLCFYEPRGGAAPLRNRYLGFGEDYEVTPREGTLLVFPAFLGHSVHPTTGPGRRIVVGFNASLR
jgi:uncharacterized protein (TIGR02466 family)